MDSPFITEIDLQPPSPSVDFDRVNLPPFSPSSLNSPYSQYSDLSPSNPTFGLYDEYTSIQEYDPSEFDDPNQQNLLDQPLLMFNDTLGAGEFPFPSARSPPHMSSPSSTGEGTRSRASSSASDNVGTISPNLNFKGLSFGSPQWSPHQLPLSTSPPVIVSPPSLHISDDSLKLHIVPATPVGPGIGASQAPFRNNMENQQQEQLGQTNITIEPPWSTSDQFAEFTFPDHQNLPASEFRFPSQPGPSKPGTWNDTPSSNPVNSTGTPPTSAQGVPANTVSPSDVLPDYNHLQQQQHQQLINQFDFAPNPNAAAFLGADFSGALALGGLRRSKSDAGGRGGGHRMSRSEDLTNMTSNMNGGTGGRGGMVHMQSSPGVIQTFSGGHLGGIAPFPQSSQHDFMGQFLHPEGPGGSGSDSGAGLSLRGGHPAHGRRASIGSHPFDQAQHSSFGEVDLLGFGAGGGGGGGAHNVALGGHGHSRSWSNQSSARASPYPSPHASPRVREEDLPGAGVSRGRSDAVGFDGEGFAIGHERSASAGSGIGVSGGGSGAGAGMMVSKPNVTTGRTKNASHKRRKNEAGFVCPVPGCGSTFTRSFNLKGHLRSHNEEKPFLCHWPGCGKGFARQHDCKRHEQLHSNYRPFTCEGCKKPFARMDALNRHLRSEGGAECLRAQGGEGDAGDPLLSGSPAVSPSPSVSASANATGEPQSADRRPRSFRDLQLGIGGGGSATRGGMKSEPGETGWSVML